MASIKAFMDIQKTEGTALAYRAAIFHFLIYVSGDQPWTRRKATADQIANFEKLADKYLAECLRKKTPRDPYNDVIGFAGAMNGNFAPKTINVRIGGVKEWLSHNRIELAQGDMKRVRRKMPKVRAISDETVITREILQQVIQHMDIRGKALVLFLASSGCRIGETLMLEERDLDLKSNPARVYIRGEITKTREPRTVFLTDEAREALKLFLANRDRFLAVKHSRSTSPTARAGAVLSDPYLFAMQKTTAREIWVRAAGKVMIRDSRTGETVSLHQFDEKTRRTKAHIHLLRKFFRSHAARALPDGAVEKLLGHEAGLQGVYSRYTDAELGEMYLGAMDFLTVIETDPETRQKLVGLAAENEQLRQRVGEIEGKQVQQEAIIGILNQLLTKLPSEKLADVQKTIEKIT